MSKEKYLLNDNEKNSQQIDLKNLLKLENEYESDIKHLCHELEQLSSDLQKSMWFLHNYCESTLPLLKTDIRSKYHKEVVHWIPSATNDIAPLLDDIAFLKHKKNFILHALENENNLKSHKNEEDIFDDDEIFFTVEEPKYRHPDDIEFSPIEKLETINAGFKNNQFDSLSKQYEEKQKKIVDFYNKIKKFTSHHIDKPSLRFSNQMDQNLSPIKGITAIMEQLDLSLKEKQQTILEQLHLELKQKNINKNNELLTDFFYTEEEEKQLQKQNKRNKRNKRDKKHSKKIKYKLQKLANQVTTDTLLSYLPEYFKNETDTLLKDFKQYYPTYFANELPTLILNHLQNKLHTLLSEHTTNDLDKKPLTPQDYTLLAQKILEALNPENDSFILDKLKELPTDIRTCFQKSIDRLFVFIISFLVFPQLLYSLYNSATFNKPEYFTGSICETLFSQRLLPRTFIENQLKKLAQWQTNTIEPMKKILNEKVKNNEYKLLDNIGWFSKLQSADKIETLLYDPVTQQINPNKK